MQADRASLCPPQVPGTECGLGVRWSLTCVDLWGGERERISLSLSLSREREFLSLSLSPGAVSPDMALCLPSFSHFVIVNKTSLFLSLSFSLSLSRSL
jgi:hypothetical protein